MAVKYLDTVEIPIEQLRHYPGNARRGDTGKIAESIRVNGQYRALVVRSTDDGMIILAGNHTRDALLSEGYSSARCELIMCTDEEAARINLADNRLAELGSYDTELLTGILDSLPDLTGTGYRPEEFADLQAALEETVKPVPEEFPAFDAETITTEHCCPKCGYEWSGTR